MLKKESKKTQKQDVFGLSERQKLFETMQKEWQDVRQSYHFPQLPQPQLVEDIPNGMIDMKNLEVKVSQPFIEGFRGKGIAETDDESDSLCMNECLTHELTHFMKYPGSVLNVLRLQKSAQGVAEGHKVSELRIAFTEAQTNLYMTNERKHPATAKMRKAYGLQEEDDFGRLMYGLYQEASGQDFGVELSREEKNLVDKLKDIDFLDKRREVSNFRRFAEILKDYQSSQQNQQGGGQGEGQSKGEGNQENLCSGKGNGLKAFTDNQIREGLKQFSQECPNPSAYEEVVKQVLEEGGKGKDEVQLVQVKGSGVGIERGVAQLGSNFYTARAEKYTIPIRRKPMHKNGSLYPHSHTSFEIGDSITEVDAFSTPGILPGITKKWIRKEGEVFSDEESVPDSFLVIDNSGSMPNPITGISFPVLGATAISNTYLHNSSKVAVYNFGGNNYLLHLTKDKEAVHKQLRIYTDGGTTFNPKFLEGILSESEGEFDISVISDMAISNLDSFITTILGIPQTHRIHLLYTKNNNYVGKLRQHFGNKDNVAILPLISEKNIYGITMGELKKSVS